MMTRQEIELGLEQARHQVAAGHATCLVNPRKLVVLYEAALRVPSFFEVRDSGYSDGSCSVIDTRSGTILATFFKPVVSP